MTPKDSRKGSRLGRGIRSILNTKTGRVGFRVQVMVNGRRAQRMVDTYEQATTLRDQWLKEGTPVAGDTPAAPASQESDDAPTHTVEDAVRWYQGDLALRDRGALGVYQIQRWLSAVGTRDPVLRDFLATPLAELDGHAILEFLHARETESLTKTGTRYKRSSILREYRVLHAAIKHFRRDLDWPNMRGKRGWCEGSQIPREPLTAEQKKRLLLALEEPYRTVAQLAMWLNPRRGSFAKMERIHCHLDEAMPWLLLPETKTAAQEIVPLEPPAVKLLRAQLASHSSRWVFPSPWKNGETPISGGHFFVKVKRAARAIGRPDLTFHALRHQFASDLLQAGYSVEQIAKAGRWGRAVRIYMHQADPDTRAMQRALAGHGRMPRSTRIVSSSPERSPRTNTSGK